VTPSGPSFLAPGGTGTLTVTAPSGCGWQAGSAASWIVITAGSSGSGGGSVNYTVSANAGSTQRAGTMTVAGTPSR